MMDELVIRIQPDSGVIIVEETTDGITARKNINTDALLECIRQSMNYKVFSGLLPQGTLSCSLSENGEKAVCLWHPELYADISYYDTEYLHFPLPRLVFGFSISAEGRVNRCRLGVVNDERLTPATPMYHYPFSNVSGFDLCTGNNPLPKCLSPHTLASIPYLLLAMPNNDDRYSSKNNKPDLEYRDLLEHLKDKEPAYYYSDILIPNHKTLQDFILTI